MTELVRLNDKWRIVDDPLQWILQRRAGNRRRSDGSEDPRSWQGMSYCMTRAVLLRDIRERAGEVDPAAVAFIESWPERHAPGVVAPLTEVRQAA